MKKDILLNIKMFISKIIFFIKIFIPDIIYIKHNSKKNKVILLEVPTYSNLGDQAIAYAEELFFKERFPERLIIKIPGYYYYWYEKFLLKYTTQSDLFVSIGGGNFGDEYYEIEERRVRSLKVFNDRPFVIFPQTVYYSDSENGKKALENMQEAISKNSKLLVFLRESASYEYFKNNFSGKAILVPDIVLFLQINFIEKKQNKILLCLRNDREKSNFANEDIYEVVGEFFNNIIKSDTCINQSVNYKNISSVLHNKFYEFKSSKVVITDRLHGMIFSVITGTPCIVMPNYNHKITSFYNTWLRDVPYIKYIDSYNDLREVLNTFNLNQEYNYNKKVFINHFDRMEECIRGLFDEQSGQS